MWQNMRFLCSQWDFLNILVHFNVFDTWISPTNNWPTRVTVFFLILVATAIVNVYIQKYSQLCICSTSRPIFSHLWELEEINPLALHMNSLIRASEAISQLPRRAMAPVAIVFVSTLLLAAIFFSTQQETRMLRALAITTIPLLAF